MAKHIVILGAGYAGVNAALETRRQLAVDAAKITVVNRQPFHQLITELHLPAAGRMADRQVKLPLNKLFAGKHIDLCVADVAAIRPDDGVVELDGKPALKYDILVVALGSETEFFGIPGLQEHSFILKSVANAKTIREHIENCISQYAQTKDEALVTFAVGGAGLTGIELVGELADALPTICRKHQVDPAVARFLSIEAMPSILPGFSPTLVERAKTSLEARHVEFLTGVPIVQMDEGAVHLKDGRVIPTRTLIWTGGVRGNTVVANSGLESGPRNRGRASVNDNLQSTSHANVFVLGDSAIFINKEQNRPFPPTAQIAGQMGVHCGKQIAALVQGGHLEVFVPHIQGMLASLGRKDAIGLVGQRKFEVKGKPAAWLKEASQLRYLSRIGGLFTRAE